MAADPQRVEHEERYKGLLSLNSVANNKTTLKRILSQAGFVKETDTFDALGPADKVVVMRRMASFVLPLQAARGFDPIALADSQGFLQFLSNYDSFQGQAKVHADRILNTITSDQHLLSIMSLTAVRRATVLGNLLSASAF